jgi:hypothetical protein
VSGGARRRRLGVIGTFVWDVIHGRDPRAGAVEEWGGIAYALAAADVALSDPWELVPIVKVGEDLAPQAQHWLRSLRRLAPDAAPIVVPYANNRVELRYIDAERRSEVLRGGVPGWNWTALAPLVRDLDAVYINMISGFELDLPTMHLLRQHFAGPIYCDLHSLTLGIDAHGLRVPQPLADVESWCRAFDAIQVNEDELAQMAPDGMALAATALRAGVKSVVITMGSRGAVYFFAPGATGLADLRTYAPLGVAQGAVRTALVPPAARGAGAGDPTGCGDVFGATYFARVCAGDNFEGALQAAMSAAARNVDHRGATSLAHYLRGELSPA